MVYQIAFQTCYVIQRNNYFFLSLQVMQLLTKLHQNYKNTKDGKAPNGAAKKDDKDAGIDPAKGRKPNFFERKRFLNYEKTSDSGDEAANKVESKDDSKNKNKEKMTKEIKDGKIGK